MVEESAWKVPLSPSGQEMYFREVDVNESLQANQAVPINTLPNMEIPNLVSEEQHSVMAVHIRAQTRKQQQQLEADQEATETSGVVLSAPSQQEEYAQPVD